MRPTSDKVRQAVFQTLPGLLGASVVDLFSGSGALAFEALSRGAVHAVCVEKDRKTAEVIRENASALGLLGAIEVVVDDAIRYAQQCRRTFDIVLCDPPYALALDPAACRSLEGLVAPRGCLLLERASRGAVPALEGLSLLRDRVYGDTRVFVFARPTEQEPARVQSAAIYPGSFDPLTNGHVDIIERALRSFDRLVLAVANNPQKKHFFSVEERIALVRQSVGHLPRLEIESFEGLVVNFAKQKGVRVLLRGVRAVSDFEYEFQLAGMNRKLSPEVETVFMVTSEESFYVASRLVKEVASFGGDVSQMVPPPVLEALQARFRSAQASPASQKVQPSSSSESKAQSKSKGK